MAVIALYLEGGEKLHINKYPFVQINKSKNKQTELCTESKIKAGNCFREGKNQDDHCVAHATYGKVR